MTMKIYLFYHSVISDWNNENAHFLRGMVSSLFYMGHSVQIMEPQDGWSLKNLLKIKGGTAYHDFKEVFPLHTPILYSESQFQPDDYLYDADLVIVHEWNHPDIVKKIGEYKSVNKHMILLFHDTHHRSVSRPDEMGNYDLSHYDGVLAFGDVIRNVYLANEWAENVCTWHEAADHRIFHQMPAARKEGDLVWIGNWGDEERTDELQEFIIDPVKELGLKAVFYGVNYPSKALKLLKKANIDYKGWLPNYKVPEVFSKFKVTVHVPTKPYATQLPGIPTIRPFEALACGIPLVCSPWEDKENLFTPEVDYLIAENGKMMKKQLSKILQNDKLSDSLIKNGLRTISSRHTCDHRAEELMKIISDIEIKRTHRITYDPVRSLK